MAVPILNRKCVTDIADIYQKPSEKNPQNLLRQKEQGGTYIREPQAFHIC